MQSGAELQPVTVVHGCEPGRIPDDVFNSDTPLLLKGLVAGWPAVTGCANSLGGTRNYLSRYWIDAPVTAYVGDSDIRGRFFYNDAFSGFNFKSGKGTLSQIFDRLEEQQTAEAPLSIYVGSTPVAGWLPGFLAENRLRLPAAESLISFWVGNQTCISAHFDFPDNIACVVAGTREFTLFPPEQVANLYVGPLDKTPSGQAISLVDFSQPDFERFPKFRAALDSALRCYCEPGDALFIPSMWWHHVRSMADFNLLVNFWWSGSPAWIGSPMTALMHTMLAVRDLPLRQRKAWRALFEHYVFDADESVYSHIPAAGRGCLTAFDESAARRLRAELLNRLNK